MINDPKSFLQKITVGDLNKHIPASISMLESPTAEENLATIEVRYTPSEFYQTNTAFCDFPRKPISKTVKLDEIL